MRELYFYHELEDMYEDMLNECYEPVSVCGFNYDQGHALRKLDPIAFRCAVSDWSGDNYIEVPCSEMTEEEREHYIVSANQVMYCHVDEYEEGRADKERFKYHVYFINEELGWGYQIHGKDNWETFRRNYGFKTMDGAVNAAKSQINKME